MIIVYCEKVDFIVCNKQIAQIKSNKKVDLHFYVRLNRLKHTFMNESPLKPIPDDKPFPHFYTRLLYPASLFLFADVNTYQPGHQNVYCLVLHWHHTC